MKCAKCGAETKLAFDSTWFRFEKMTIYTATNLCNDCGKRVLEWIRAGIEHVDLELVRRPRL